MKLGMTSLTFREKSVETVIRNAKEAGISGIEWGVSEGHMELLNKERAEKQEHKTKWQENTFEIAKTPLTVQKCCNTIIIVSRNTINTVI